jgi:cytochrome c-type biogenesis protein CcmH
VIWVPVIALAGLAFLAAVLVLKLPRAGYSLLGAALLFGLAGYAVQGRPGQPSAPAAPLAEPAETGELFVTARRAFHDPAMLPSRFLITSDAFARRGDYARAAAFARSAVRENADDVEAWTALANALVEHADGRLTPAALHAYREAARREPRAPGPRYFLGLAYLRAGDPARARALWAEALAVAPADAPWRGLLAARLARLEALLAQRPGPPPV